MARRGRWSGWERYERSGPRAAEGGIKAKSRRGAIGDTWWSKRFVAVLESFGMGTRLARGKRYARSGQVMDLQVAPGRVTARVQGSRRKPYEVSLALEPFDDVEWDEVIEVLSEEAIYAAQLLAGEMPEPIEDAFEAVGLSLFPDDRSELTTACSCPDWANPCKHLAATLFILAERFDEDPFQILAWRGRGREALLEDMRAFRGVIDDDEGEEVQEGEPLEDPRSLADAAGWYGGSRSVLEEAQRRVAAAEPEGARAPLLELLGPSGIDVDGVDLAEVLKGAW